MENVINFGSSRSDSTNHFSCLNRFSIPDSHFLQDPIHLCLYLKHSLVGSYF